MWTVQFSQNGILKAKEFSTEKEALDYALAEEKAGNIAVEEILTPEKETYMNREDFVQHYRAMDMDYYDLLVSE